MSQPAFATDSRLPSQSRARAVIGTANRKGGETVTASRAKHDQSAATFDIDWISVCLPSERYKDVRALVGNGWCGRWNPCRVPNDISYCQGEAFGPVKLFSQNRYKRPTLLLIVPGEANPTRHLRLLCKLRDLGGKIVRIDLAFTDTAGLTSPAKVFEAIKRGERVSKSDSWEYRQSGYSNSGIGETISLGSRRSEFYIRIYRQLEASDEVASERPNTRWEMELKDRQAQRFVHSILATLDDRDLCTWDFPNTGLVERFKSEALKLLKSRLSFRERKSVSNVSRAQLSQWWTEVLEYFDPPASDSIPHGEAKQGYQTQPDWEEAERRRRERSFDVQRAHRTGSHLLFELYDRYASHFGTWSQAALNDPGYRPRLRLVYSNDPDPKPAQSQKVRSREHLQLIARRDDMSLPSEV